MAAAKKNQYALGCTTSGRPRKYATPAILVDVIEDYFQSCDEYTKEVYIKSKGELQTISDGKAYTIEGLCVHLGIDRQTFINYRKREGYEEFFEVMKWAAQKIHANLVERGINFDGHAGFIQFLLTNNADYANKQEIKQETVHKIDGIEMVKPDDTKSLDE